jgi:hypothetical protein
LGQEEHIMAIKDKRAPQQPAEDMFGRPTDLRNAQPDRELPREHPGTGEVPKKERADASQRHAEAEAEEEVAQGGVGELADGDGPRSDRGTNPLPSNYWSAYPEEK